MTDEMKSKQDVENAMLSLREEYEQTATSIHEQPEPKEGQELKRRRFPKVVSYLMGSLAVMMLVAAVFLFSTQGKVPDSESVTGLTEIVEETAVTPDITDDPIPTPPFIAEPPIPDDAIPPPPEPTPWPTPPIELESPPEDDADSG